MGRAKNKESVDRILVGVRLKPSLVKVMKGVAELHEVPLGQLLENIFLEATEGKSFFSTNGKLNPKVKQQLVQLKEVYGVK